MTRGLVVLRCGRSSLHWDWLDGPQKNWDLILCPYQDIDARGQAARVIPGQKWDGLARFFAEFNGWRDYDYICLPDDDIATNTHTLNAFFDFCHRFEIDLAAPALTPDSYFSHPITMKNTEFVARRTSFVEIMMPCFSRAFFQEVLPTFGLSRSGTGFGLDYLWPHMLSYEDTWIFDEPAVHHTRPVGGLRQQRLAELAQADLTFIRGLGIPMTPKTLGGVGHDETFLRFDAQEFGKRYHRGNAYLASHIPEWSRHIDNELSSAAPAPSHASRDHIRFALEHLAAPDRTISRGRPSRSSSTSQWSWSNNPELEASGANDGRLNGCCGFHTNHESNPWWQVDLGTRHAIESVVIYNRLDQMMRCVDFDILVSDDAGSWRLAHAKRDGIPFGGVDGNPYRHDFVPPAGGRFIRIQLAGTGFLHLDQVEVFGSPESSQTSSVVMTKYSLDHLTQDERQQAEGPIQDDEALFLFSIIRGMRIKTVFEIGGLNGYSATNFLQAVGADGVVFTCDINPVRKLAENHFFIHKNALDVQRSDLHDKTMELVFFDCHDYNVQMMVFHRFRDLGIIDSHTVLALHDTNTHPYKSVDWAYPVSQGGYVHQPAERKMVNDFVQMGYHAFCLHTRLAKHSGDFPYRHGVTIMSLFTRLET